MLRRFASSVWTMAVGDGFNDGDMQCPKLGRQGGEGCLLVRGPNFKRPQHAEAPRLMEGTPYRTVHVHTYVCTYIMYVQNNYLVSKIFRIHRLKPWKHHAQVPLLEKGNLGSDEASQTHQPYRAHRKPRLSYSNSRKAQSSASYIDSWLMSCSCWNAKSG